MKIKKIVSMLLVALTVAASFASCNRAGMNYSDKNAYVSVYVYGENGKTLLSVDALRVAPDEEANTEQTNDDGLLTEESARNLYRTTPTGMYALELAIRNKDKNAELPGVVVSQFNGEVEYTLDTIMNATAGKASGSNDIFEWEFTINGEKADPFSDKLSNYDKVAFTYKEQTYRSFTATFRATNGAVTVFDDTKFTVNGEKSEMTISKYLLSSYIDDKGQEVMPVADVLGIKLSEDGKKVVAIGDIEITAVSEEEEAEEPVAGEDGLLPSVYVWRCLINDEPISGDLTENMINEKYTITFDYYDIANAVEEENEEDEPQE